MPIAKVESVAPTKSGKALRVKLGGSYYNAFLDSGLDKVVGQMIDFQTTPDKGYGLGVGQWGTAQAEQHPAMQPSAPNSPAGALGRLTEPELRFVSNVVGSAIIAKSIIDPMQIGAWTKAAATAVKEV